MYIKLSELSIMKVKTAILPLHLLEFYILVIGRFLESQTIPPTLTSSHLETILNKRRVDLEK